MSESLPILIVGAGPTGLTAAMELSRLGIPIRLVDKLTHFSDTSRALAIQARTMELFQQRGLADEALQLANKGRATTIYSEGKTLGRLDLGRINSRFNYITLLAQSETERILRERVAAQGVVVEMGTELVAMGEQATSQSGEILTAVLKKSDGSSEQLQAAFLIASDGSHSLLRHTLQLPFPGKSLPHTYALADLHADTSLPEDELSIFLTRQGLLALFPMGKGRFRLIATGADEADEAPDPTLETMQRLYDDGAHIPAHLHGMVWSSHFRINSRMLSSLRAGRVFFGGDAAHVHSPAGGQGMNTGIQDMVNLCWKLAMVYRGKGTPELLDTYEAERLPVIKGIVSTTERATDVFNSPSPLVRSLLHHIAPLILHSATVQSTSAGLLSETEANYSNSPLSGKQAARGTLHPGVRIPDLEVCGHDPRGPVAGLLDLLDPSAFTLLVLADKHAVEILEWWRKALPDVRVRSIQPGPQNAAAAKRFHEVFSTLEWALVRPDGYLALAGKGKPGVEAATWKARWFAT